MPPPRAQAFRLGAEYDRIIDELAVRMAPQGLPALSKTDVIRCALQREYDRLTAGEKNQKKPRT